ncbi:hypothetical protein Tco_0716874 [Tanacetum coccineum]
MTGNRRLFTSYMAYDGGHVVFGRNLKGKVVGGGNITHDSITITNVEPVSGLAFNLISVAQLCDDDCMETMRIEESLNVTFDESLPEPKSYSSVEDDRIIKPVVQNPVRSSLLEANASYPGYPKSLKEARGHPIEKTFLKLCMVEDLIWEKITRELKEPFRNTHVDEYACCQVQYMMEVNVYALRKEIQEIHATINNNLKGEKESKEQDAKKAYGSGEKASIASNYGI